jgi:hypothetical protein
MGVSVFPVLLAVVLIYISPVSAREGGANIIKGIMAQTMAGMEARANAMEHLSERGLENSSAQWSPGAPSGQDRSALRKQGYGKHERKVVSTRVKPSIMIIRDMGTAGTTRKTRTEDIKRIEIEAARVVILIDDGQKA